MATQRQTSSALAETKRVGKFGIVGIINTIIDFGLFNILIGVFELARIPANIISTTCAMIFSFIANKRFVFGSNEKRVLRQAVLFLLVTAFGLYVIQNLVIYFLTEVWLAPLDFAYDIVTALGLGKTFSHEFVINNGAKVIATLFSLTWNYLLYKRVVFKK